MEGKLGALLPQLLPGTSRCVTLLKIRREISVVVHAVIRQNRTVFFVQLVQHPYDLYGRHLGAHARVRHNVGEENCDAIKGFRKNIPATNRTNDLWFGAVNGRVPRTESSPCKL